MEHDTLKPHERWALVVCAYRLDADITAASFVEALERYEAAVRRDERVQPGRTNE